MSERQDIHTQHQDQQPDPQSLQCESFSNPIFLLTKRELEGLIRFINHAAIAGSANKDVPPELKKLLGEKINPNIYDSDLDAIKRFYALLDEVGRETEIEYLASIDGQDPIPLLEVGRLGEDAKVVLDYLKRMVIIGLDSISQEKDDWSPKEQIERYLAGHPKGYGDVLETYASMMPPIANTCLASICIPVASHEEGDNIYRTLKSFLNQSVSHDKFEIVLFLNHPEQDAMGNRVFPDHTPRELARFCQEHSELRVRTFKMAMPETFGTIGFVRKLLTDVVLWRAMKKEGFDGDYYLLRADADTCGVHPQFVENYLKLFERYPDTDSFAGKLDWDWPSYLTDPILFFGTRFYIACSSYINTVSGEIGGGGANFAMRASSYAAAGGYPALSQMAEDVALGIALRERRSEQNRFKAIRDAGAKSRLYTSSRRSIAALEAGFAPVMQWSNDKTPFSHLDGEIRSKLSTDRSDLSYEELLDAEDFPIRLELILNQTIDFFGDRESVSREELIEAVAERSFGLQLRLDDEGRISVQDCGRLKGYLRWFAEHADYYWYKTLKFS